MGLFLYISNECPVKIWDLTSAGRIERVLKTTGATRITAEECIALKKEDFVLLVRGDYLFDDRLINYLAVTPDIILQLKEGGQEIAVAANVPGHLALQALEMMEEFKNTPLPEVLTQTLADISISFEKKLRKFEPPFVLPITEATKQDLERRLFDWSYKGITDLVTKWAWPRPARWAVGHCVRLNIRPNHVTMISLVLVIFAGIFFATGHYGWGLLCGWLMTFLDTVDGKLARVTVTSSKFGHYFDHLIDLIHPPIWYILWGLGLTAAQISSLDFSLSTLYLLIMIGYVAGRLVEGSFKWFLGATFGIFCWHPIDSYFRLITARRNPNMILLTISIFVGRPELGLLAVTFWTVATSTFLLGRFVLAGYTKFSQNLLRSWLSDADKPMYENSLAVRLFTRHITK